MEKNNLKEKSLKQNSKNFKFKILYNTNQKNFTISNKNNITTREILKILYLLNFEEELENNVLNRNDLNLLNLWNLHINKYTNTDLSYNPIFKNTYNYTFSIIVLYKLYKSIRLT